MNKGLDFSSVKSDARTKQEGQHSEIDVNPVCYRTAENVERFRFGVMAEFADDADMSGDVPGERHIESVRVEVAGNSAGGNSAGGNGSKVDSQKRITAENLDFGRYLLRRRRQR